MENIRLPTPFKEFFALLNQRQVEYLLVGGYAVSIHGYIRATGDIDIWIAVSAENSARVVEAFQDFGFSSLGLKPESFNRQNVMLQIGAAPIKIEVMTSISGVDFDACFKERVEKVIDGVLLNLISFERLLENKKATGRPKDQGDVDELEKRR